MPVREIVLYPDALLREKAADALPGTETTAAIIQDLLDTLDNHTGVGIAAPQIGESVRIIAVDATRAKRPVANHGRLVLLNPEICASEGQTSFREGCLSIPDLVARVSRANEISIDGTLPDGSPISFIAEGFEAVILQHEIDHLDGILFIDRVYSARDIKFRS
ncbi:MAG: peptide deformylase [Candidatus Sumerlaeaceae bacterium]